MVMPKGNRGSGQVRKIQRLFKVVERLQTGRRHSAAELAHLCTCSVRTTFRDIKLLTDAGLPIMHDDSRQGYWIPTERALPASSSLSKQETVGIFLACDELGKRVPFLRPARDAALKLLGHLSAEARAELKDIGDTIQIHLGAMVKGEPVESIFQVLFESLSSRRKVRIAYDSLAERQRISTLVSPYALFFGVRAWYLVGRSSVHRTVYTFNLSRILSAAETADTFTIPPRFTIARFLGNAWNMIPTAAKDVRIVIRFLPPRAADVEQVRWHKTQQTWWNDDGSLHFEATVAGLAEVTSWILGYGQHAQVLEPPELREAIAEHARNMLALY